MSKLSDTLEARERRYGDFKDNARIAQSIKWLLRSEPSWIELEQDQKEALDQIASKIGRMMTGDPNYPDSWHDIAGYATLIEKRLTGESV